MIRNSRVRELAISFSLEIMDCYRKLQEHREYVFSRQILRSSTSIGANIFESIAAESTMDFVHKLHIALKEAYETRYWLILLQKSNLADNLNIEVKNLNDHLTELIKLLTAILVTTKKQL